MNGLIWDLNTKLMNEEVIVIQQLDPEWYEFE